MIKLLCVSQLVLEVHLCILQSATHKEEDETTIFMLAYSITQNKGAETCDPSQCRPHSNPSKPNYDSRTISHNPTIYILFLVLNPPLSISTGNWKIQS